VARPDRGARYPREVRGLYDDLTDAEKDIVDRLCDITSPEMAVQMFLIAGKDEMEARSIIG
jgi:hypothetical protein